MHKHKNKDLKKTHDDISTMLKKQKFIKDDGDFSTSMAKNQKKKQNKQQLAT